MVPNSIFIKNEVVVHIPAISRHGGCNVRHFIWHQIHQKMRRGQEVVVFSSTFIGERSREEVIVIIPHHRGFIYVIIRNMNAEFNL